MSMVKKLVVVGDGACGKTCLLSVFSGKEYPEDYIPTVIETYQKKIEIDGKEVEMTLCDTAGQEEFDRLRPLAYPKSNVILLCFAIDDPNSFINARIKWVPEIKHFLPGVPFILVGNKLDLRTNKNVIKDLKAFQQHPVTSDEGYRIAKKIGAAHYMECSALTLVGVKNIFQAAARLALQPRKQGKVCAII